MSSLRAWLSRPGRWEILVRGALIAVFVVLAARWWHPYYGFTRFLQMDGGVAVVMTPALRDAPIYVHWGEGGYDGHYYGQLASDPLLRDPDLVAGMDNLSYRARRILTPALAYVLAGGERVEAVRLYAALNVVAWLALAVVLWGLLPVGDARRTAAWAGLMLSAGVWHSVRLALADLPALVWLSAGWWAWERKKIWLAAGLFAAAALSRETALLAVAVVALLTVRREGWPRALGFGALAALPILAWMAWLGSRVEVAGGGWHNFSLSLPGFWWKWREVAGQWAGEPDRRLFWAEATLLASVTGQIAALAWRWPGQPVRWLGAAYAALALLLSVDVWGGYPPAAPRVLLPLSFAFWLLLARGRAAWGWFGLGGLGVVSAVLALAFVPQPAREFASGRAETGVYRVEAGAGFFTPEDAGGRRWVWCGPRGELRFEIWPKAAGEHAVELQFSARTDRLIEVGSGDTVLAAGRTERGRLTLTVPLQARGGRGVLWCRSAGEIFQEPGEHGRALSFALNAAQVR